MTKEAGLMIERWDLREAIATAGHDLLGATCKNDALRVADALRAAAVQCESLAEQLPAEAPRTAA